jgi:flagellar biosynthesis/type III secretory pathway chaperone
MLQSLKKKSQVLDEIVRLNDVQKDCLTDIHRTVDEFDKTVEDKSACIGQLEQLDSGFEKLYAQVAQELEHSRERYANQIREMQRRIRSITEKSVKIQAQEVRNRDLMREKFSNVRRQATEVRAKSRAIESYYNSMKQW